MKKNLNKILLVVVVVLFLALVGILSWKLWFNQPSYYAVYLRTGDLYFGELTTFPTFTLKHVYMLQINSQNQQNPLSIQKFTNVFWGPEDYIKINRSDVVWYTRLASDSRLAQLIQTNPSLTSSQNPQDQTSQDNNVPPQANGTSSLPSNTTPKSSH
ncbi:hypothetical protein M1506_03275 [Patescibacteria group bacterium]|nr:hypothetical protein [Patescibacteria group bacterium]